MLFLSGSVVTVCWHQLECLARSGKRIPSSTPIADLPPPPYHMITACGLDDIRRQVEGVCDNARREAVVRDASEHGILVAVHLGRARTRTAPGQAFVHSGRLAS